MFVETEEPLPVGTEVAMRFAVPGEPAIDVIGVVTWVQAWRTEQQPRGMGMRFDHLEARHGEAIDRIVSGFRGLRMLVLSADAPSRTQLGRSLRTIVGTAEVIEAADGDSAEMALARDCDLVIVEMTQNAAQANPDLSNPGGSADALLLVRLAKSHQPPVPVLALAAAEDSRFLARELGADATLSSPPPFPDLQSTVLRLLGTPKSTALK
jgi:CheY-like chemotaxis protein